MTGKSPGDYVDIPGNQMFVIFHTNGNIGGKGFNASILESMLFLLLNFIDLQAGTDYPKCELV